MVDCGLWVVGCFWIELLKFHTNCAAVVVYLKPNWIILYMVESGNKKAKRFFILLMMF